MNILTSNFNAFIFSDACSFLMVQLDPLTDSERKEWLDRLTDHIQRQSLNSPVIEKDHIEKAIQVNNVSR